MESSRDDEWMKELEGRLRKYTEQPDDALWSKIATSTESKDSGVAAWWDYAAVVAVLIFIALPIRREIYHPTDTLQKEQAISQHPEHFPVGENNKNSPVQPTPDHDHASATHSTETTVFEKNIEAIQYPTEVSTQDAHSNFRSTEVTELLQEVDTVQPKPLQKKDSVMAKETEAEKKPKQKRKRTVLFAQITPSLSFWHVQPRADDELTIQGFEAVPILSFERAGISLEAGFQFSINKKWDFFAGASTYYQKQTLTYMVNGAGVVMSKGDQEYSVDFKKEDRRYAYAMLNLGATSGFLRTLHTHNLKHKLGVSATVHQGLLRSESGAHNNASSVYALYSLLYRAEYPLRNKRSLYVQPTYSRTLFSTPQEGEPFVAKPSRAGIALGIIF